ncbi:hypothetical protein G6F53_004300 [Rhizopus delemar]|nr:hypothetical protein G6F53_004300 [Rhizopus delemar]
MIKNLEDNEDPDGVKNADIAFVFSNSEFGEYSITVDGNVGDRNNSSLWHNGDNLIHAVADANKNTVVVIHSVDPVLMPWIDHPNIKAVASDYNAKIDPSAEIVYKEKLLMGYKWFDAQNITPQFPFDHGLSHTNFTYSNLK